MANWIECDYNGTEQQHKKAGMNNRPVNLDHVATYNYEGSDIIFIVPTKDNIRWEFINQETMRLEVARIDEHIVANPR